MDPELNPFTPGAGLRPPALEGRDKEIEEFDLLVARSKRHIYKRGMMLSGLRGVGKTVLLNKLAEHSEHQGWLVTQMEARATDIGADVARRRLVGELRRGIQRFSRRHQAAEALGSALAIAERLHVTLTAGPVGLSVAAAPAAAAIDWEFEFESMVEDIVAVLRKRDSALGIFIDELQDIDDATLESLLAVQHTAAQRGWPFFLIGAGLPNLPSRLADCRSYAERQFDFYSVGALGPVDAGDAVTVPTEKVGGSLMADALDIVVHASEGYPYFLQEYGKAIWSVAEDVPFTAGNAYQAVEMGTIELDAGFYPSRWDRLAPTEQDYMRAMADTGEGEPRSGAIAERLGKVPTSVSRTRDSLIKKGLVWAPAHGRLSFTVPGMAEFIRRQPQ